MMAALWLARVAVMVAFTCFIGIGLAGVEGGEGEGGEGDGCEGEGGEGEGLSSASLLLFSLRLALLARSRLLLPEWCKWAWAAVEQNQKVTSSVHPSVSSTSFAGNPPPPILQRTHARYWLCAPGGGRVPV